jgi:hypothetical protein
MRKVGAGGVRAEAVYPAAAERTVQVDNYHPRCR